MTFYLPNTDVLPTGFEPAEFIDPDRPEGRGPVPATREYVGAGITVHWDSGRCIHSGNCRRGAPTVFHPAARPWVHLDGADADEVARVIDTCPSGALTYTRTDSPQPIAETVAERLAIIAPQLNGPLSVKGPVGLTRPDGSSQVAQRLLLCRCGHSASKPNCDGSHIRVGFSAPGVSSERTST
jgi:uncharacterized Fe-S cluster protein YjdI/CDGSH-type Zn-finger protein